jgi:hypothetical protein
MNDVSLFRLYLLRAMYLLIVVGLAIVVWPGIIHQPAAWGLNRSVIACMLGAFSALSVLGLRYPLQMLPLLMWELVWKSLWLGSVALPQWLSGNMDAATWQTTTDCLVVVIVPFVIPWKYVFAHYVTKRADRWRSDDPAQARSGPVTSR